MLNSECRSAEALFDIGYFVIRHSLFGVRHSIFWPFFLARFAFLPSCLFLVPYPVDPVHPVDPVIFFSGGNTSGRVFTRPPHLREGRCPLG